MECTENEFKVSIRVLAKATEKVSYFEDMLRRNVYYSVLTKELVWEMFLNGASWHKNTPEDLAVKRIHAYAKEISENKNVDFYPF